MRKAYTKTGDEGYSRDFSGEKISKSSDVIIVGGKIDFLQSAIDLAILKEKNEKNKIFLEKVQKKLWQLAGQISKAPTKFITDPVNDKDLEELENFIDSLGEPPQKFVRFKTEEEIIINECRVRCRELEISLVPLLRNKELNSIIYSYINRLSSLFFMMAYKKTKQ